MPLEPNLRFFCVPILHPIIPAGPTIGAFKIVRITLFLIHPVREGTFVGGVVVDAPGDAVEEGDHYEDGTADVEHNLMPQVVENYRLQNFRSIEFREIFKKN